MRKQVMTFIEETVLTFEIMPPLYLPFYNRWGANAYYTYEPFDYDPFTLRASSTSGSPVILTGSKFFGFMTEAGGRFSYDGKYTLTMTCPKGQSVWCSEDCNPYDEWQAYNAAIIETLFPSQEPEPFWSEIEYCTWVEQKKDAVRKGSDIMQSCLCEDFVYSYMRRVEKLGLPKGKLTIDDGWDIRYAPDGRMCYGNWEIDRIKFPHMERLVKDMSEEGFTPGLWFAPFTFTPNSELARKYPDLIGETFSENAEDEAVRRLMFIKPDDALEEYYRGVFYPYIDMGFKKFKLDMSYGRKNEMKQLLAMMYRIIKERDKTVEVEAHIPDLFVTRFCDTVRINDVNFECPDSWRAVTTEHYKVSRYSSPDRILNLDHLGTNTSTPKEADYLEHVNMLLKLKGGYPCVSLLPDFFGTKATEIFVDGIREWESQHR